MRFFRLHCMKNRESEIIHLYYEPAGYCNNNMGNKADDYEHTDREREQSHDQNHCYL